MRHGRWQWVVLASLVGMVSMPVSACKVGENTILPSREAILARDRKDADLVIVGSVTPTSEVTPSRDTYSAPSARSYRVAVDHVEKGSAPRQVDVDEDITSSCDLPFHKRHLAVAGRQRIYLRQEDGKWMIVNSEPMTIQPVGDEAADYDLLTRK